MQTKLGKYLLYKSKDQFADYCMNHVFGCAQGCQYPCVAFEQKKRFGKIQSYEEWTKPVLIANALNLLDAEIPRLKKKIESVAAEGVKVLYYVCDAADEHAVEDMRDWMVSNEGLGGCDILVCAQGYNKNMFTWEFDGDAWNDMINININSVMNCCRYFGNWMKENNVEGDKADRTMFAHGKESPCDGYGKIILFASVRSLVAVRGGGAGNVPYNTTKGAVELMCKAFASELRPNIQVNAIGPTLTYTPMMVGKLPPDESVRNSMAEALPAMRIGYEEDVMGPAIFLASAASDMVTGSTIFPDGGLTCTG